MEGEDMHRNRWAFAASAVLAPLIAMLMGCSQTSGDARAGEPGPRVEEDPIPIAVESARIGQARSFYTTTASLEAEYKAEIRSRSEGVVRKLFHEEGDRVEKGTTLLRLEDDDQLLRVKQAELDVAQAETEFARRKRMFDAGVLSSEEFDQNENELKQAKSALELARLALSYTEVEAPFSGRVVRRMVDLGANVSNGAALFEMMDVDPLLVRIYVPATRLGKVAVGQTVEIGLQNTDMDLRGVIRLVSPVVDPETGTVKVTAEIRDYPDSTRPGDFVDIRLVTDSNDQAVLVPSIAVIEEQGSHHVFITAGDSAHKRDVEVGFADGGLTEIKSGVETGELVVVKGQRNLRDGVRVDIIDESSAADPKLANVERQESNP